MYLKNKVQNTVENVSKKVHTAFCEQNNAMWRVDLYCFPYYFRGQIQRLYIEIYAWTPNSCNFWFYTAIKGNGDSHDKVTKDKKPE